MSIEPDDRDELERRLAQSYENERAGKPLAVAWKPAWSTLASMQSASMNSASFRDLPCVKAPTISHSADHREPLVFAI